MIDNFRTYQRSGRRPQRHGIRIQDEICQIQPSTTCTSHVYAKLDPQVLRRMLAASMCAIDGSLPNMVTKMDTADRTKLKAGVSGRR